MAFVGATALACLVVRCAAVVGCFFVGATIGRPLYGGVRLFFVGDGLARPVTINKSRIVWWYAFVFGTSRRRPLQVCAFFGCAAVGVYLRQEQAPPLQVCAVFGLVECDSPTYPSSSKKRRKRLMEKQRSESPSPARSKK